MRYAILFKVSKSSLPADIKYMAANFINHYLLKELRKSILLTLPMKIDMGHNDIDFIKELVTIRIQLNAYKIPRIIKTRKYGLLKSRIQMQPTRNTYNRTERKIKHGKIH